MAIKMVSEVARLGVRVDLVPFLGLLAALEDSGLSLEQADRLVDLEIVPAAPDQLAEVADLVARRDKGEATTDNTRVEIIQLFRVRPASTTQFTRRSQRPLSTVSTSNGQDIMPTLKLSARCFTFAP